MDFISSPCSAPAHPERKAHGAESLPLFSTITVINPCLLGTDIGRVLPRRPSVYKGRATETLAWGESQTRDVIVTMGCQPCVGG